jgi:hypothetical protein
VNNHLLIAATHLENKQVEMLHLATAQLYIKSSQKVKILMPSGVLKSKS